VHRGKSALEVAGVERGVAAPQDLGIHRGSRSLP
jgi:hypothetical protein